MIYLDHAATTPIAPDVLNEMMPYLSTAFGNPSSLHTLGQEAKCALDLARDRVASLLRAVPGEIIFTSGGTEADNLAIRGLLWQLRDKGRHLIVSSVEHEAILQTSRDMEHMGWAVTYLPVDARGRVDPEDLKIALRKDTVLVSVMTANNEVGTLQPISELAEIAHGGGALFHTDAVQAVGVIPVHPASLGVDLLSLSGHKIYGPKGTGALWARRGLHLSPQMTGGGQERDRRSGTENVAGLAGLGKACELAESALQDGTPARIAGLRDLLLQGVLAGVPGSVLTGHPTDRLPGIASFLFPGLEGEAILLNLDFEGIAVSSGSACSAGAVEPSHVLLAMGCSGEAARGAVRISLGRGNTREEIEKVISVLTQVVRRMQAMR